ncbi:COMM domain-containing protein 8-like [Acropora palmata]|uniref:COMM domain-containing protein 8-like n=1 Tax=Acropora palmata TaxID=6131 RepID=UPI003DA0382A
MADGAIEDNHRKGLRLLKKCSKIEAEKVTHALLDSICSGKTLRYEIFGKLWTIEEWKLFQEAGKEELMQFIAKGLSKEQITTELERHSLSAELNQAVLDCLWPRREEMKQSLVQSTAMVSNAYLKDFDWKVKMIMASDRLASIREPTLTLDFNIDEHGEEKHISVELTSDELKNLISSLESANKVVMQLKK